MGSYVTEQSLNISYSNPQPKPTKGKKDRKAKYALCKQHEAEFRTEEAAAK